MLSGLRTRRKGKGQNTSTPASDGTTPEIRTPAEGEDSVVVPVETIVKLQREKFKSTRARIDEWFIGKRRVLFPLGLAIGVLTSFFLLSPLPPHIAYMLEDYDLSSLSFPGLEFEWGQITDSLSKSAPGKLWAESRDFRVGTALKEQGLEAEHPVILVPGIVSTGLESWTTAPEYRQYFRKRLWGTTTMVRAVLTDRDRWISALMLDPDTGLDPPGLKVRAAQGLDAASTFMPGKGIGYWIWSKIIENLAVLNYDSNNLHMAAYDWRLSYYNLEVRDGYSQDQDRIFQVSFLKWVLYLGMELIINIRKREGKKVVLVSHSMGGTVVMYFLKWVEAPSYVGDHIEAYVNIAGTLLGVPKAMSAFVSGEMRDTVEINPAGAYVLEKFFSRKERARLFRSWAGSASMWIKILIAFLGGRCQFIGAPDDPPNTPPEHSHARFFNFRSVPPAPQAQSGPGVPGNLSAAQAGDWVLGNTEDRWQRMMALNYSYGIERDEEQLKKNGDDHTKFSNPLEVQLPNAPSMRIYCLYGHGKDTERSYWYAASEYELEDSANPLPGDECAASENTNVTCVTQRTPLNLPFARRNQIDTAVHNESGTPRVKSGVRIGEGDGTVALLSLGAMCVEGWKPGTRWNPHGVKVITQEMAHKPEPYDPRGGEKTSDHIDILGSEALNEAVLRVAAGRGEDVEEKFVSNIREYAKKIRWD
ncbi:phospholipid: diacylglycerol acyltransferase [Ceratobasidium sp. AG-Ba]|nr:phospholipid: diacylglycerol acyltransferase [Ceratobasidium sp. AG-Ba]